MTGPLVPPGAQGDRMALLTQLPAATKLKVFNQLAALYDDDRFLVTPRTLVVREFAEAFVWSRALMPGRLGEDQRAEWWRLLHRIAGVRPTASYARLVYAEDRPRWVPDDFDRPGRAGCEAVLTRGPRQGQACGKSYALAFQANHDDGTWHLSRWCAAHRAEGERLLRVQRAEKDRIYPEPPPNRGGLLPVHLPGYNWVDRYRLSRPDWEPSHWGIRADDWPVLEKVRAHEPPAEMDRPTLRLIPGGAA